MLTAQDFVYLPYTPDMTQAGIHHACRSFPIPEDHLGGPVSSRLQRIIARKAAELGFRRHLSALELPFENWAVAPITAPLQYDVTLGKRRCVIQSLLIPRPGQIQHLRQEPAMLLSAAVFIPEDQLTSGNDLDLFVFACVLAQTNPRFEELRHAQAAGQPMYLIHPLPAGWVQPAPWAPLGPLSLWNEHPADLMIELGGLDSQHRFIAEPVTLPPGEHCPASREFYSLFYVHSSILPAGRLEVHSARLRQSHEVQPRQWENLWLAGSEIILLGWISRGNFRLRAAQLHRASQSFLHPRTTAPHRWLPIDQLNPLHELFETTRQWASDNSPKK